MEASLKNQLFTSACFVCSLVTLVVSSYLTYHFLFNYDMLHQGDGTYTKEQLIMCGQIVFSMFVLCFSVLGSFYYFKDVLRLFCGKAS
jgi:hypothetical protein